MAVFESYLSKVALYSFKMKRLKEFISKLPKDIQDDKDLKQFFEEVESYNRDEFTISFLILPEDCQHVLLKFIHKLYMTDEKELLDSEERYLLNQLNSIDKRDKTNID